VELQVEPTEARSGYTPVANYYNTGITSTIYIQWCITTELKRYLQGKTELAPKIHHQTNQPEGMISQAGKHGFHTSDHKLIQASNQLTDNVSLCGSINVCSASILEHRLEKPDIECTAFNEIHNFPVQRHFKIGWNFVWCQCLSEWSNVSRQCPDQLLL